MFLSVVFAPRYSHNLGTNSSDMLYCMYIFQSRTDVVSRELVPMLFKFYHKFVQIFNNTLLLRTFCEPTGLDILVVEFITERDCNIM